METVLRTPSIALTLIFNIAGHRSPNGSPGSSHVESRFYGPTTVGDKRGSFRSACLMSVSICGKRKACFESSANKLNSPGCVSVHSMARKWEGSLGSRR